VTTNLKDTRTSLVQARTFFLAGAMQGSRPGQDVTDQSYRRQLREIVLRRRPDAEVRDPAELMVEWLAPQEAELRAAHARLADQPVVEAAHHEPGVIRLTEVFTELVALSAASDVCIAWLPEHEASMGTAIEMWAAHAAGRTVVAITTMRQNLAVLACSSLVVPTLQSFERLLERGPDDARDR
jgi:hypothetical protein